MNIASDVAFRSEEVKDFSFVCLSGSPEGGYLIGLQEFSALGYEERGGHLVIPSSHRGLLVIRLLVCGCS